MCQPSSQECLMINDLHRNWWKLGMESGARKRERIRTWGFQWFQVPLLGKLSRFRLLRSTQGHRAGEWGASTMYQGLGPIGCMPSVLVSCLLTYIRFQPSLSAANKSLLFSQPAPPHPGNSNCKSQGKWRHLGEGGKAWIFCFHQIVNPLSVALQMPRVWHLRRREDWQAKEHTML